MNTSFGILGGVTGRTSHSQAGHLYIQSNEIRNTVIHYGRAVDGSLVECERINTEGKGSGIFKPVSGQLSAPNAFEGAGSVILADDNRLLFATNGGDNSVSSFRVDDAGSLTLLDVKPTGNPIIGRSGTAKSLAYASSTDVLYVLHAFGPDHLRAFSVSEGMLTPREDRYSVNTPSKLDRIPTQVVLSPDERFLLVDILFDERPSTNADGTTKLVVANASESDGLVVFPVQSMGNLGSPSFHDAGAAGPFYIAFLHGRNDTFINGTAVGDGLVKSFIDREGNIRVGDLVPIDTKLGKPSELCWLAISPDNARIFATNFGYGNISTYEVNGENLSILQDPACVAIPGDGTFRAVNGLVSSGPSDNWLTPDGKYLYQIYGNAAVLIGYAVGADGALTEITRVDIPYNSPQGLAGF